MIRWGIVGLGNIAGRFARSLRNSEEGQLYAVASKNSEKRGLYAAAYPGIVTYQNYEDLLQDKDLDVVYIALPHSMHKKFAIKALLSHKGVLCEKPIALNESDAQSMVDCARDSRVFLMEAMKTRFVPLMDQIRSDLNDGIIGDITDIHAGFCYDLQKSDVPAGRYIIDPAEGGALLDAGPYPIAFAIDILGHDFTITQSSIIKDEDGLILSASCKLQYQGGAVAHLEAGMDRARERTAIITGMQGVMKIPVWNRPTEYSVHGPGGRIISKKMDLPHDDLFGEIEEVHRCLRLGLIESERYSWRDTLKMMETIDSIQRNATVTLKDY